MTELLLQTIDLSTEGAEPAQTALAVGLLVCFALILVIATYALQFVGLSAQQKREKKTLLGQRESQTGMTLRLRADDDLESVWDDVRALFGGDQAAAEEATLRTAIAAIRQELGQTWGEYATTIPRLARWLLELAVGLAVSAALVHVSVSTYESVFSSGGGGLPSPQELLADAGWALRTVASTGADVLGAFPYADLLWALAFAYTVQFASWVYDTPSVVIVVLLASAAGVILLDRRAPEARDVRVTTRFSIWSVVIGGAVVWLAGAVPAAALSGLGYPGIGAVVGLLAAAATTGVLGYLAVRALIADTRALVRVANDPDRPAVAYLVVRRLGAGAASLAAPLIPVYLVAAVVTGQLSGIIGAFLGGSLVVQAAVGLLGFVVMGAVAWGARASGREVRSALANLRADTAVRLAVFRRGVPIIVMTTVYLLALGFGLPWLAGLALALTAGVAARALYALFRRVRYRITQLESDERTPRQVQVRAHRLETAAGETRYYAEVNAVQLAHEDADALTDAIIDVAGDLFDEGDTPPRVERAFAEDLVRFGIVDIDETREKLVQTAREEAEGRMPQDAESLEERVLERVPQSIWDQARRERLMRGEWSKRDGRYYQRG